MGRRQTRLHQTIQRRGLVGNLLIAVVFLAPPAGLFVAIARAVQRGVTWWEPLLLAALWVLTAFGIEGGYHRLFCHRGYRAVAPLRWAMVLAGSLAWEGPLGWWVAAHRIHHQKSDRPGDVHSPYIRLGEPEPSLLRGFLYAHLGWIVFGSEDVDIERWTKDLRADRGVWLFHRFYLVSFLLSLALPALLGRLLAGDPSGWLGGLLWGGLARIFCVHHATWSINSICHLVGGRPFRSHDYSGNVGWLALPTMGASWHNNHHAFPSSACYQFSIWQLDPSWWLIRVFSWLGLASDLVRPGRAQLEAKRVGRETLPAPAG